MSNLLIVLNLAACEKHENITKCHIMAHNTLHALYFKLNAANSEE